MDCCEPDRQEEPKKTEEKEDKKNIGEESKDSPSDQNGLRVSGLWIWVALGLISVFLFTQLFEIDVDIRSRSQVRQEEKGAALTDESKIKEAVLPSEGVTLPVKWNNLGKQMVDSGVIDADAFEAIYAQRGGLTEGERALIYGENNGNLEIDAENAGVVLNLLWAFGLSNKNPILEEGPMQDPQYGGADRFASTGGWTLAKGNTMDHYSKHAFITLTPDQQELVERVSKNIYRPCCGNSTYFPDCNHGMAMLGFLELMASEGVGEEEMYKVALQVNSYWFPDTYLTIAKYFGERGVAWDEVNSKDILGLSYSSASGYRQILAEVEPPESSGGPSCGV